MEAVFRIVIPMAMPGLATIGLFLTLGYWNDWFNALMYLESVWILTEKIFRILWNGNPWRPGTMWQVWSLQIPAYTEERIMKKTAIFTQSNHLPEKKNRLVITILEGEELVRTEEEAQALAGKEE